MPFTADKPEELMLGRAPYQWECFLGVAMISQNGFVKATAEV